MTQTLRRLESADIFANVDALLPEIRRRSAEIAAARRLPRDLVDDLKTAGVFRIAPLGNGADPRCPCPTNSASSSASPTPMAPSAGA